MPMCACLCMHTHMHTLVYVRLSMYVYTCTGMGASARIHVSNTLYGVYVYVLLCTRTSAYMQVTACMSMYAHTFALCARVPMIVCVCKDRHIDRHRHIIRTCTHTNTLTAISYALTHNFTRTHICMHHAYSHRFLIHVHIHVHSHVHIQYTYTYKCIGTCIHTTGT